MRIEETCRALGVAIHQEREGEEEQPQHRRSEERRSDRLRKARAHAFQCFGVTAIQSRTAKNYRPAVKNYRQ